MKNLAICGALAATLLSTAATGQCLPPELKKLPSLANYGHGTDCALEGNTLLVGLPFAASTGPNSGEVWVYERNLPGPDDWGRLVGLLASDKAGGDRFGSAVDLSGDLAVIGSPWNDDLGQQSGSLYVFDRNAGGAGVWGEINKITGSQVSTDDNFGTDVAIFQDWIIAGCIRGDGNAIDSGTAYVFHRKGTGWTEEAILSAPSGATSDTFGRSVDIYKDYAIVGSPGDDVQGNDAGMAYVFQRTGTTWSFVTRLDGSNTEAGDSLGSSVAIHGDTVLLAAPFDDDAGPDAGAVYVYQVGVLGPGLWSEIAKLTSTNPAGVGGLGLSVDLSGDVALAGAFMPPSGAAFLFHRDEGGPNAWGELGYVTPSDLPPLARFGYSVSIDGTTLAVGAPTDDSTYVYQGPLATSPELYCTAGVSANGCQAQMLTWGTPSATAASGFVIAAQLLEGNKDGLFFFGSNGRQAKPWGNGTSFHCVVPPVKRAGLLNGTGTSGVCDGRFQQDLNALWCPTCPKPGHNPGAGAVTQAQLWYRDPQNTSNQTTSLSDAVEFTVCP